MKLIVNIYWLPNIFVTQNKNKMLSLLQKQRVRMDITWSWNTRMSQIPIQLSDTKQL